MFYYPEIDTRLQISDTEIVAPGEVIKLPDFASFFDFENSIANNLHAGMTPRQMVDWSERPSIDSLVRPREFNGKFANIQAELLPDPMPELCSANDRGYKFIKGYSPIRALLNVIPKESYFGIRVTADASSTGSGIIGEMDTEIYYAKAPYNSCSHTARGDVIRFVARRPTLEAICANRARISSSMIGGKAINGFSGNVNICPGVSPGTPSKTIIL